MENNKNKHSGLLARLMKNQKGAVLPLIGLVIGITILASGFAVDYARAQIVHDRMQMALDAAAIAGARAAAIPGPESLKEDRVRAEAMEYFKANFPDGFMGTQGVVNISVDLDIETRGFDIHYETNALTVNAMLVKALGISNMSVGNLEAAVKTRTVTPMDVVMTLDVSGSMAWADGTGCEYSCGTAVPASNSRLEKAKGAMKRLTEMMDVDGVRIGLVPWDQKVNYNGTMAAPDPNLPTCGFPVTDTITASCCGCASWSSYSWTDSDGNLQTTTYCSAYNTCSRVTAVNYSGDARGCTYRDGAAHGASAVNYSSSNGFTTYWGTPGCNLVSRPASNSTWRTNAAPPSTYGNNTIRPIRYLTDNRSVIDGEIDAQVYDGNTDGALGMLWARRMLTGEGGYYPPSDRENRVVIHITDGTNTRYFGSPPHTGDTGDTNMVNQCNQTKNGDARGPIRVYTIAYNIPNRASLQACASQPGEPGGDPSMDMSFNASDANELRTALETIAYSLMTIRLTK